VSGPPRLVVRTMAVTFVTVALILFAVFIVLTVDARDRARAAEIDKLQVSERVFTALEARRQQDQLAAMATLTENPTLKAALDTYVTEENFSGIVPAQERELRDTVQREADKLAQATAAEVLGVVDTSGMIFVSAGPARDRWPVGQHVDLGPRSQVAFQRVAVLHGQAFRVSAAALQLGDRAVGTLVLATSLDSAYATELAGLSGAGVVITVNHAIVARTIPANLAAALVARGDDSGANATLDGEEYAVGMLLSSGPARIYTLTSIDAAARAATRSALVALASIAGGSMVLAALGSLWLARTLTRPINHVAESIATMTAARDFGRSLAPTGSSQEVDALTGAFNELMQSLTKAEAETESAYVGAIRALAAALDARDPYTAGHSERVSALSVLMAQRMNLTFAEIDTIRLGALMHDIGKIGLADDILRKAGALTAAEFEQIKRHPTLGARILRQVPFLSPHLPIVELHHERPDGLGYPLGLRGDDIPLAARIVHVADAFDAMTSTRAYRPSRTAAVAVAELRRHSGSQFDPPSVAALCASLPEDPITKEPQLVQLFGGEV
jgi:putative nucleotidyltransferase with HDIG domain